MPVIEVPASQINDWDTFHDTFAQTLGFPDFYGRNMNAWIDCLTYADEDDGMRAIAAEPGEVLTLQLQDCRELRSRCPEIYEALIELRRLRELAAHRKRLAIHPRALLPLNRLTRRPDSMTAPPSCSLCTICPSGAPAASPPY